MRRIIFLQFLTFFLLSNLLGQEFNDEINESSLTIDSISRFGYNTSFDFSAREVTKGWWAYSREFGHPLNMKSHYQLTIPADEDSISQELVVYSKTIPRSESCMFFICLKEQNLPKEKLEDYRQQLKEMLWDFKRSYYVTHFEKEIRKTEKKATRISRRITRAKGNSKNRLLDMLEEYQLNIDNTKSKLREINNYQ